MLTSTSANLELKSKVDRAQGWQWAIIRSLEALQKYREDWTRLQWHPNADFDFYSTFIKCRSESMSPWVALGMKNGEVQTIVAGRIEQRTIDCRLGYLTLYKPVIRSLEIIYGGFMGDQSKQTTELLMEEMQRSLTDRTVDAVHFHYLAVASPLHQQIQNNRNPFCRDYMPEAVRHWKTRLPTKVEDLFKEMNAKNRSKLRRLPKYLEEHYPGKVSLNVYGSEGDLAQLCRDAEQVMAQTYQRGLGVGFTDNQETRDLLKLAANQSCLVGYVLSIENRPCAYWIGTIQGPVLYLSFTGHNAEFHKYEVGTIVLVKMMEDICRNRPAVREIDFGFGDALYKSRFGNVVMDEVSSYVFASRMRAVMINITRTALLIPSKIGKALIERLKLEQRLKTLWRARLAKKASQQAGGNQTAKP